MKYIKQSVVMTLAHRIRKENKSDWSACMVAAWAEINGKKNYEVIANYKANKFIDSEEYYIQLGRAKKEGAIRYEIEYKRATYGQWGVEEHYAIIPIMPGKTVSEKKGKAYCWFFEGDMKNAEARAIVKKAMLAELNK